MDGSGKHRLSIWTSFVGNDSTRKGEDLLDTFLSHMYIHMYVFIVHPNQGLAACGPCLHRNSVAQITKDHQSTTRITKTKCNTAGLHQITTVQLCLRHYTCIYPVIGVSLAPDCKEVAIAILHICLNRNRTSWLLTSQKIIPSNCARVCAYSHSRS